MCWGCFAAFRSQGYDRLGVPAKKKQSDQRGARNNNAPASISPTAGVPQRWDALKPGENLIEQALP